MGNLMCCCNSKLLVTSSMRNGGESSDHTQPQREHHNNNAIINDETSSKKTKLVTSKKILPIENVDSAQGLERTISRTVPKTNRIKLEVLDAKPTVNGAQQVSRNVLKGQQCNACGELDHLTENCRYHTRLCFYCREEGHIVRICPKLKRAKKRNGMLRSGTSQVPTQKRKNKLNHMKPKRTNVVKR